MRVIPVITTHLPVKESLITVAFSLTIYTTHTCASERLSTIENMDDILRLEEVIDLSAGINDVRRQEKRLIDQGIKRGACDFSLKIKGVLV